MVSQNFTLSVRFPVIFSRLAVALGTGSCEDVKAGPRTCVLESLFTESKSQGARRVCFTLIDQTEPSLILERQGWGPQEVEERSKERPGQEPKKLLLAVLPQAWQQWPLCATDKCWGVPMPSFRQLLTQAVVWVESSPERRHKCFSLYPLPFAEVTCKNFLTPLQCNLCCPGMEHLLCPERSSHVRGYVFPI